MSSQTWNYHIRTWEETISQNSLQLRLILITAICPVSPFIKSFLQFIRPILFTEFHWVFSIYDIFEALSKIVWLQSSSIQAEVCYPPQMRAKDPCQKVIPLIFRVEVLNFSDVEIMILCQYFIWIWRILMSEKLNFNSFVFFSGNTRLRFLLLKQKFPEYKKWFRSSKVKKIKRIQKIFDYWKNGFDFFFMSFIFNTKIPDKMG